MSRPFASRLQLPPGDWRTVLDALCARFPAVDRCRWRERMARGEVQDAQGRAIGADAPYRVGLELTYLRGVEHEAVIPFEETVLHHDEHLLVADKPHFLPVTPGGAFVEQTLLRRLARRLDLPDLVPLHRIDRETAGLVMFSTRPGSRDAYQALFRERRIDKSYEALAPALQGTPFPLVRRTRIVAGEPFFRMQEVAGEANSETRVDVIERGLDSWHYRLEPVTGRKHQLRVHMASLGAPILDDRWYPTLQAPAPDDWARPLALLAKTLAFRDPLSGVQRRFESGRSLRRATD